MYLILFLCVPFVIAVTEYAIPLMMQPEDNKKFKSYIKEFAERVNG